jgi:glycosyltransferase 2 family protein
MVTSMQRTSASLLRVFRIALALGMLIFLVVKIGHTKPLQRLAMASPLYIALAIGIVIVDGLIRAWNWCQLVRAMHFGRPAPYRTLLSIYWSGSFLGQFVPSTVGTDALRAMIAARNVGGHASTHGAAVVMLNAISLASGCLAGLASGFWLASTGQAGALRLPAMALFAMALSAAVVGYVLLRSQRGLLLRLLRRMHGKWRKLRRGLRRFMHRLLIFERYDVKVTPIIAVAFFTLVTRASMYALVGLAVGVTLPFPAWLALVPAYSLSGLLPYNVSGYGGDQAAIVYILTGFGATGGDALAFALIVPLITVSFNMLGGLSVLFGGLSMNARPVTPQTAAGNKQIL